MELKWSYALLIVILLSCGGCLDWMGAGNLTIDNLTVLHNMINGVNPTDVPSSYTTDTQTISDDLNTLWDPAWNVIMIYFYDGNNYDSVLYGYGFRGHWFWLNGWQTSAGKYVTFIIWKDYNCVKWSSYNAVSGGSSYSLSIASSIRNNVTAGVAKMPLSDIWSVAESIQPIIQTGDPTLLQDPTAYTIIASQSSNSMYFGRVCISQYVFITYIGTNTQGAADGSAFVFQMRNS